MAGLALSSARSCHSSICPDSLSVAWLVSLVVFSCRMVSSGNTRSAGASVVFEAVDVPFSGPFPFSRIAYYIL